MCPNSCRSSNQALLPAVLPRAGWRDAAGYALLVSASLSWTLAPIMSIQLLAWMLS